MAPSPLKAATRAGKTVAGSVDHTVLKPEATEADIRRACNQALFYQFAGVCVHGTWISLVAERLGLSQVKPVCVVGFPLGAGLSVSKADETSRVISAGAQEIDMVLNIGALKDKRFGFVRDDIAAVVKAAAGRLVKVILECCLLTRAEKLTACRLSVEAGAAFVKTSTGFNKSGATIEDVKLLRQAVGPSVGVKAAGGIRDLATARAMLEAGASRLGTSASVAIVTGAK